MRKADYSILAAAIEKHGVDRVEWDYTTEPERTAARLCAEKIARTFARFANVDKVKFLESCGIKP